MAQTFRAADCFEWWPMEHAPGPDEHVFVLEGKTIREGCYSLGRLMIAPKLWVQCKPDAWSPFAEKLDPSRE